MGRTVNDGPRINPNLSSMGTQHTEEAKTPDELTLPKLNGILDELGLGTLTDDVEPYAKKGSAADTPRQDGPVRDRGESVKNFFKAIGKGISDFFSKIGSAFSTAFEAIKEAVTSRTATAETPTPTLLPKVTTSAEDRQATQTGILKDFCRDLGNALETDYKTYLADTQDDPPMTRGDFVKQALPDPQGGADEVKDGSLGFIGNTIDAVRTGFKEGSDPGLNETMHAIFERFTEFPTLDIAASGQFSKEVGNLTEDNVGTFLRTDCAFTRLDKFEFQKSVPIKDVAQDAMESVNSDIWRGGDIAKDGLAVSSMDEKQCDVMFGIVDQILDNVLSTEFDEPQSFLNQIPDDYKDSLSEKAEEIMGNQNLSVDDKKQAVRNMYVNSLFLRGISPELVMTAPRRFGDDDMKSVAVTSAKIAQTFFNGNTTFPGGKGSPDADDMLQRLSDKHASRMDLFLVAVGMPAYIVTADDEKATL